MILLKTVIIPNQQYKEAMGKYDDSIKAVSIGDTKKFGHYEQDNSNSNGKEEIKSIVIARDDDRVLVISKYALDCQQYNSAFTSVTWETCSLWKWMNEIFLETAFDSREPRLIQNSTVTADMNPSYNTSPGNVTADRVFLLSITEAEKYFSSDSARTCQATSYCYAQRAGIGSSCSHWWLRSPGIDSNLATRVSDVGSLDALDIESKYRDMKRKGKVRLRKRRSIPSKY